MVWMFLWFGGMCYAWGFRVWRDVVWIKINGQEGHGMGEVSGSRRT